MHDKPENHGKNSDYEGDKYVTNHEHILLGTGRSRLDMMCPSPSVTKPLGPTSVRMAIIGVEKQVVPSNVVEADTIHSPPAAPTNIFALEALRKLALRVVVMSLPKVQSSEVLSL